MTDVFDVILPASGIPLAGWVVHATALHRALGTWRRDPLTGLYGRRAWENKAERVVRRNARGTVLLVDLNDFKTTNDTEGHAAGDSVLVAAAHRLARVHGVLGRLGGDEFVVALAEPMDAEQLEDLRKTLAEPVEHEGRMLRTSAAIGVCRLETLDQPSLSAALKAADRAMYADKGSASRRGSTPAPLRQLELVGGTR